MASGGQGNRYGVSRSRRRPRRRRVFVIATGLVLLAGCAGTQDSATGAVAEQLLGAARNGDGATACDLLAPATRSELESSSGSPCEEAILEEDLGEGTGEMRVEVYDTSAQVKVGGDTVFLSRFDGRWLVVAAACTAVPDRPYDCSVGLP